MWKECSYRHKLTHIDKLRLFKPSPVLSFGTSIHAACEDFLKTREMKSSIFEETLKKEWETNKEFDEFNQQEFDDCIKQGNLLLNEIPDALENEFPQWEFVDAEHMLNEQIEGKNTLFKGFIDGVIKYKKKNKEKIFILDWKTSSRGWFRSKLMDTTAMSQVVYYKYFWSKKTNVPMTDIKCGYIVLNKSGKIGQKVQFVFISAGEVTVNRSLKVVNNMISTLNKGIAIKNKSNCTWCEYANTQHCT